MSERICKYCRPLRPVGLHTCKYCGDVCCSHICPGQVCSSCSTIYVVFDNNKWLVKRGRMPIRAFSMMHRDDAMGFAHRLSDGDDQ